MRSLKELLFFGDLSDLKLLKLLVKVAPSDGPPATAGKTPRGNDIFGQLDAYPFVKNDISNSNIGYILWGT